MFIKSLVNSVVYSIYMTLGILAFHNHVKPSIGMNFYFM